MSAPSGDALNNAPTTTHIGLFETELLRQGSVWERLADVEPATLEWVDGHHRRRHTPATT